MAARASLVEATAALPARRSRPGAWTALARFCQKKPLGAAGGAIMLVILLVRPFGLFGTPEVRRV